MTLRAAALALLVTAAPATAQRVPIASPAELQNAMAQDATVEVRVDGDLNGDGETDTAFVENGNDSRRLHVLLAYRTETDLGHDPAGSHDLDSSALGPAQLSVVKGVLVVKDLTGGTSAIEATYRYRWDAAAKKMRLIGLDASSYSRTFQHDTHEISWNLLTGDFVSRYMKLKPEGSKGDEAYFDPVERKRKRPSRPLYLDSTPDPDALISGEKWPAG